MRVAPLRPPLQVSAVTSLLPVNRMFLCPVVSLHLTDVHLSIVPPHFLSSCSCYSILEPDFLPWCHLSSSVTAGIILFVLVPLAMAGRPSFHPWYCDTHCFTCRHTFSSVDIFSTCSTSSCASPIPPRTRTTCHLEAQWNTFTLVYTVAPPALG